MKERRYSEEEVAAIFERAEEAQKTGRLPSRNTEGLTLRELEDIGREVGIPPELVTRAARELDRGGQEHTRRLIGLPLGVGRTVQLDRALTEEEWQHLVVDLRQTFDARGKLRVGGGFREWTNGNLQALVEPTPEGDRLRLRTLKGSARGLMTSGLIMLAIAMVIFVVELVTGGAAATAFDDFLTIALIGAGLFGFSAAQLPGWARLRRQQMHGVADRLQAAVNAPAPSDPAELPRHGRAEPDEGGDHG